MEPLYVIAWTSKQTGLQGQGSAPMKLRDVRTECRKLNREHPSISHYPKRHEVCCA